jgi:hypothetical protein
VYLCVCIGVCVSVSVCEKVKHSATLYNLENK